MNKNKSVLFIIFLLIFLVGGSILLDSDDENTSTEMDLPTGKMQTSLNGESRKGNIEKDWPSEYSITGNEDSSISATTDHTAPPDQQDSSPKIEEKDVVTTKIITVTESIPFQTVTQNDPSIEKGEQAVSQDGAEGVKTITYIETYRNGVLTSKEVESSQTIKKPVNRIVLIGIKEPEQNLTPKPEQEPAEPDAALLDIPLINQYPEFPSGCEATALTMALNYYGVNVSKTTIVSQMPIDPTPRVNNPDGTIKTWGDPEAGYVGDARSTGITINPNPLKTVADQYRPGSIASYGRDFSEMENYIKQGKPVLFWITLNYKMPIPRTWKTPDGKVIYSPRPLHCVVVTGVDDKYVYFNDSDAYKKNVKVEKSQFINVYNAMGKRALVVS